MVKSPNTERSRPIFVGRHRPLTPVYKHGGLFLSALPRQALHEATGNCSDDDDAHKQGRGHPDDQGEEEQVSSWRRNPEMDVKNHLYTIKDFYQLILLSNI